MKNSHEEFEQRIKLIDTKTSQTKNISEEELKNLSKEGRKNFLEYKRQRMKNKYHNWTEQRKQEGKDYSEELFLEIQKYLKSELEYFEQIYQEISEREDKLHAEVDEQIVFNKAKMELKQWRKENSEYLSKTEDIEEFRWISDSISEEERHSPYCTRKSLQEDLEH